MEINYIGHFLLEQLFLPALRASTSGKIVHVSSESALFPCRGAGLPHNCIDDADAFDRLVRTAAKPNYTNYGLTKFMMIYNARELSKREAAQGSRVRAFTI